MAKSVNLCRGPGCGKSYKTRALVGRHEKKCLRYHQHVGEIPIQQLEDPPLAGWRRFVNHFPLGMHVRSHEHPAPNLSQSPTNHPVQDYVRNSEHRTRTPSPIPMEVDLEPFLAFHTSDDLPDHLSRSQRNRRLPRRYRDMLPTETGVLPTDDEVSITGPEPPAIPRRFLPLGLSGRVRLRLRQTVRSAKNAFGLSRLYLLRPTSVPKDFLPLECDVGPSAMDDIDVLDCSDARTIEEAIDPYPNLSAFLYNDWFWRGGKKSKESRREQQQMFKDPRFDKQHVAETNFARVEQLVASGGSVGPDGKHLPGRHWKRSTVHLQVPHGQKRSSVHHPVDPASCIYDIPGVLHRSLVAVIEDVYSSPSAADFHFTPFKLLLKRSHDGVHDSDELEENVYGEIYSSLAFAEAHESIQALPAEPDCELPRAVAATMLMSDTAHLSDNGRAKIHPLNFASGNQTFYERRKPRYRSIHPIAYFPELSVAALQAFVRDMPGGKARKKGDPIFTHCRRELFHGVLGQVLDDEFWTAYEHGIVVDCADGIRRRLYPRFFAYTADYPEKALVTTIRDQGKCPCPNDLTPAALLDQMGTVEARTFQAENPRMDTTERRKAVEKSQKIIHKQGFSVTSKRVEAHLQAESYVPTKNAFSDPRNRDNIFSLPLPDPMHEGGSGTWLAVLQHLIRILHSLPNGEDRIITLNQRLNAVGPFSNDVVRQLSENVADLTQMKIYEYESILKDAAPCFEGLFPDEEFDSEVQDLLFSYARWYILLNLSMHTDSSLRQLDSVTSDLGNMMRRFQVTSADKFRAVETPPEAAKRVRAANARGSKNVSGTRRDKTLNLSTYKFHSMGHCVSAIARVGVTPNYTTSQNELSLREPIGDYERTSRKDYESQIVRNASIKNAHYHMRAALERLGVLESNPSHPAAREKARRDDIFKGDQLARFQVAKGQDQHVSLKDFALENAADPAFHDFRAKLQSHCLARLVGGISSTAPCIPPEDRRTLKIDKDRIYPHNLMSFNYTTYDVRRAQDLIHVGTSKQHIMLLSEEDEPDSHPFWYARVVGIFHVNITHEILAPNPTRMDVLYVRWFGHDPGYNAGWMTRRLDRIGFVPESDPDAFGFVDPSLVVRACHLIAGYAHGRTGELLGPSKLRDVTSGDWRYYFVDRFADNDMMMRYTGIGVGHAGNCARNVDMREPTPIAQVTQTLGKEREIDSESEDEDVEGRAGLGTIYEDPDQE